MFEKAHLSVLTGESLQKLLVRATSTKLLAIRRITQENRGKHTAGMDGVVCDTPQDQVKPPKKWLQGTPGLSRVKREFHARFLRDWVAVMSLAIRYNFGRTKVGLLVIANYFLLHCHLVKARFNPRKTPVIPLGP